MKLRSKILTVGTVLAAALIAVTVPAAFAAPAGQGLFKSAGCGGCHTLAAAGGKGKSATNLDTAKVSVAGLVEDITTPPTGMPTNSLSAEDIQTLSTYIVAASKCDKLTGKKNKKKKAKCLKKIK